ncbi:MAG: glycosyltransferase [Phycisphaerales bacterium]
MPEPIRVLHMLPDLAVGGGQHLLLRHLSGMDPGAVENHVCVVGPPEEMRHAFEKLGVPCHTLGLRSRPGLPLAAARLVGLLRRLRVEVVHTNNTALDRTLGYFGAMALRLPVVNSLHSEFVALGGLSGASAGLRRRASRRVGLWAARRVVAHTVAVSRGVRRFWEPYLREQGATPARVSVVYPGLEPHRFRPPPPERLAALRDELRLADAAPVLLNVGKLIDGKGQRHLVRIMPEVLARHPRAVLLLAGDGPDQPVLEAMIRERSLGPSVRLLGRRDDVAALLWLADLFVFPSHSEGFPLSVLEAMAAARPVVAFRLPAFQELVSEDTDADLVPIRDEPALLRAILRLLADPALRRAMGDAAQRTVSRFTQRASSRALEEIYRSLVPRARPPGDSAAHSPAPP